MTTNSAVPEVFISYSSRDRERVLQIADQLEAAGISVWIDRNKIEGGANYGPEIVRGIKGCKTLVLMCSNNSLRSRNVKQEIQLAWKYERPYLPLLLEQTTFPEQIEYWLEGWQWIEILESPPPNNGCRACCGPCRMPVFNTMVRALLWLAPVP